MKFTLSWLKDHLETEASLEEIVDTLTRIGLEVERVDNPAAALKDFSIAYVIEARPHPNADRLRVCMVDAGGGAPVQVVCGAPNARAGMKSVFSPPGTYIPGKKITLGKGVIRGVESLGMLCSAAELELSDEADGIIEVAQEAPIGAPYVVWAGLDEPVIEINLTPNRPDATGVFGIARDLAAAGLGRLKGGVAAAAPGAFPCPTPATLAFDAGSEHLCPAFALRLVRGVRNGPSPAWMQKRLKAIGLRPINALVDITNYLTFDRGRPLHVFDADKVHGALVVRRAHEGESVKALDGRTYGLEPSMVVIADDQGVESIAGVMGGEASGCDEGTVNVLIESALWDPANIAQTGRRLAINTDARYRFERGVDPEFYLPGIELATGLVLDLCGGEASELALAHRPPGQHSVAKSIDFPWSEVERLTGVQLPVSQMAGILEKLGFKLLNRPGNSDRAFVQPPSWRPDVQGKADLVEEVVRIVGLDRVVAKPLPRLDDGVPAAMLTLLQRRKRGAQRALAAIGLVEAVTWSFISRPQARMFGGADPALSLANPIAADLSDMRPSLIPGLLAAAKRNADRGLHDVALFEVGQTFTGAGENDQRLNAAALRRGEAKSRGAGRHWADQATGVDVFDAKADALALLAALGVPPASVQIVPGGPDFLHPGRRGVIQLGPKNVVGWFGELHPLTLEAFDATGPVAAFEITLDDIPAPKSRPTKAKPKLDLAEFMPIGRDFAFVVDQAVAAGDILKAAQAADRSLIASASVFDVYAGPGVTEGKKSVAVAVTLQPREKTLTEAEIDAVAQKIIAEVGRKTGASLR